MRDGAELSRWTAVPGDDHRLTSLDLVQKLAQMSLRMSQIDREHGSLLPDQKTGHIVAIFPCQNNKRLSAGII